MTPINKINLLTETGMHIKSKRNLENGCAAIVQCDSPRTTSEVEKFMERQTNLSQWWVKEEVCDEFNGKPRFFWLVIL